MSEFVKLALAAGFTKAQAEFMKEYLSEPGHTHEIEDVEGLEEALALEDDDDGGDDQ